MLQLSLSVLRNRASEATYGFMPTKLGLPSEHEQALRGEIRGLVPIKRMGSPWELAKAAVFLASDESGFVVGSDLLVDGGVGNR